MLKFTEDAQYWRIEYHSYPASAMVAGLFLLSTLALFSGDQPIGSLLAMIFSGWAFSVVYEHSAFRFDAVTRQVSGQRKRFRNTKSFNLPFADIRGVALETERSGKQTHRITLLTQAGPLPLVRTYSSNDALPAQAQQLHTWLRQHGIDVPLHQQAAPDEPGV